VLAFALAVAGERLAHVFDTAVLGFANSPVGAVPVAVLLGLLVRNAIGLPAVQALLVFAAIGIGMALPYLAASWVPSIARLLPRPGAWMVTFRKLMAFPMFATVAWLVWVLGQQSGIDGAGALLVLLVAMSMLVWALTLRGRARTVVSAISLASLALLGWTAGPSVTRLPPQQTSMLLLRYASSLASRFCTMTEVAQPNLTMST
jgi:thiol:disulfide interchange protein DsbD